MPRPVDRKPDVRRRTGMRLPPTGAIGLVALGGALGALARAAVGTALAPDPGGWPWGTMVANLTGALLLGLVLGVLRDAVAVAGWARPLVATGIIGGYTTFSTLSVEALQLLTGGHAAAAAGYVLISALAGLVAMWAGLTVARARRRRWRGR